jgi:hypothetical protein
MGTYNFAHFGGRRGNFNCACDHFAGGGVVEKIRRRKGMCISPRWRCVELDYADPCLVHLSSTLAADLMLLAKNCDFHVLDDMDDPIAVGVDWTNLRVES